MLTIIFYRRHLASTDLNELKFVNLLAGFFRSHNSLEWRQKGVALVVKLRIRCLASMNSVTLSIPMVLLTFINCWNMMTTDMMTSYWPLIPSQVSCFCHIIRNFPRKSSPVTIDSLYPEAERWRKATTNVEHKLDISWTRKIRLITPPWPITA